MQFLGNVFLLLIFCCLTNESFCKKKTSSSPRESHQSHFLTVFNLNFTECGKANEKAERIVNGRVVPPHKYPWMAGMFVLPPREFGSGYMFYCGGSVITPHNIITAGMKMFKFDKKLISNFLGHCLTE